MPLSKEKQAEYMKRNRKQQGVIPSVIPKGIPIDDSPVIPKEKKCNLENCVICNPEGYQQWFKKTYGVIDKAYTG